MEESRRERMQKRVERMGAEMDETRANKITSGRGDERMKRMLNIDMPETVSVSRDEDQEFTGTAQVPTEFRYDGGEMLDWDVIITSTREGGKPLGDMDVPEKPVGIQYALKAIMDVKATDNGRQHRKYQIGRWEVDADHQPEGMELGSLHYMWLKVPSHANLPRTSYAEQWAQAHCKPGGVGNMVRCLMQWWAQGITHVRIQFMPQAYEVEPGKVIPAVPAQNIRRVEKFYCWDECRENMRLVQAAYRAMRAASSDQYVPESASLELDMAETEDVSL